MNVRVLYVALCVVLALGTLGATGAFTTGDRVAEGVYLEPADTPNGERYAEIRSDGEFSINVSNLNPDARSVVHDVFVIGTDLDEARVWIEDNTSAVDFYRMDTRESIEDETDPVRLTQGESVLVGFTVQSGQERLGLETITLHAQVPGESSGGDAGSGGDASSGTATPTETPTTTATETPAPTRTPTPAESGTDEPATPRQPDLVTATATPTETPTPTATATATETPEGTTSEVGTGSGGPTTTSTATDTSTTTDVGGGGRPTATEAIQVVDLSVSPERASVGQSITVTATVENRGSETGTTTVELRAGGEVIATETVTLAAGERTTITATTTFGSPGAYEIQGQDESVTVTVDAESQSLLEVGGFGPTVLGLLALLAVILGLFALWRRDEYDFVVTLDDGVESTLELVAVGSVGTADTDGAGRAILGFDVAGGDGHQDLTPAFAVRNTGAESVRVRVQAVDEDGAPVTDGVSIEGDDGRDLTASTGGPATAIGPGEEMAVTLHLGGDAVERIDRLRVDTGGE